MPEPTKSKESSFRILVLVRKERVALMADLFTDIYGDVPAVKAEEK